MRRLLLTAIAGLLALTACGGDDGESAADDTAADSSTTTTEARPTDTTFATDDVEALCADLEGLAEIDPDADPTQDQVDQILAIAATAPSGVADPLSAVAAYGQLAVDAVADPASVPDDAATLQTAATDAATVLVAYGNEACAIDVPLFDALAGV